MKARNILALAAIVIAVAFVAHSQGPSGVTVACYDKTQMSDPSTKLVPSGIADFYGDIPNQSGEKNKVRCFFKVSNPGRIAKRTFQQVMMAKRPPYSTMTTHPFFGPIAICKPSSNFKECTGSGEIMGQEQFVITQDSALMKLFQSLEKYGTHGEFEGYTGEDINSTKGLCQKLGGGSKCDNL